jgi:malate dehydrogenase
LQLFDGKHYCWQVRLGKNGVEEVLGLGTLSDYEQNGLDALKEELRSSIQKGIDFVNPQHA